MNRSERKYDIVLLGATGFTGRLTAEYLWKHQHEEKCQIALAGRNKQVLADLFSPVNYPGIFLEICDITDYDAIIQLCLKTKVLMNAAGPFSRHGMKVIKACLETGTHYLDITGEPTFVAEVYSSCHAKAKEKEVCIVNCCGFDSIPADFTTWMTAKALPHDQPIILDGFVRTNAEFSGGTLNTAIEMLYRESKKTSVKYKIPRHPNTPKTSLKIHKNHDIEAWAIPMPVVDPHIVKRSIYSLPLDYGYATAYRQFFVRSSFFKMLKTVVPVALAFLLVKSKVFRDYMLKKYPPGSGPSEQKRKNSFFEFKAIGHSGNVQVSTTMKGGDPGYTETSMMFSQAAFCILNKIKQGDLKSGVCSPVEALGDAMVHRLKKEGISINQEIRDRM